MKDLLQGNKTINQLDHNAYTGDEQRKYKFTTKNGQFFEELKVQSRTKLSNKKIDYNVENIITSLP
jgi:5'(3')-deoxyribonucleotidase